MWEVVRDQKQTATKLTKPQQINTFNANVNDANSNIPEYCRSNINRTAYKELAKY